MHQRRTKVVAAAIASLLASCSGPPVAQPAPSVVEALAAPGACYARSYDEAHLAAHPRQTVTRFFLGDPGEAWRASSPPGHFNIAFGFQLTDHPGAYTGVGICERRGEGASCD